MTDAIPAPARRAAAGAAGLLLAVSGLTAGAMTASADEDFGLERLAGPDRYATAASIATDTFTDADTVLLASGGARNYPDALAGNYLAGAEDAPILLTAPTSLPAATRAALRQLSTRRVTILGGTAAVSAGVQQQLEGLGLTVTRRAGDDRYRTAREVARTPAAGGIGSTEGKGRTAVLASGRDFADALTAGPLGFKQKLPVLITEPGALSAPTRTSLDELDIRHVLVVGGTAAVSQAAEDQVKALGIQTRRIAGGDRRATAVAVAEYAIGNAGFVRSHVDLATGLTFADALTGGPHAGREAAPILLTESARALGAAAREFLTTNCPTLTGGHVFGGTAAVSDAALAEAQEAATCAAGPSPSPSPTATATSTIAVAPDAADTRTAVINPDTAGGDDRTFTASGLVSGQVYRITLVRCENVRGNGQGVTFLAEAAEGSSTGFGAVTGAPTADILSVNGEARADSNTTAPGFQSGTTTFTASGATATFVVDGDEAECVVPVVYFDASTSDTSEGGNLPRLEVSGPARSFGAPAEDVDVAGRTSFTTTTAEALNVDPDETVVLDATANPDTTGTDNRPYTATGLVVGEEYRVTLVRAGLVRGAGTTADPIRFSDTDNDNLTETGAPTADITTVNGQAAVNNTGDGTATTATNNTNGASTVFTATASTATFVVDGDSNDESVRPVLYRNGGPAGAAGNTAEDGGNSPRLELNDDDTAAEPVAVGGATSFFESTEALNVDTDDTRTVTGTVVNSDSTTTDDVSYSLSGLIVGQEYRVTLVRTALITGAGTSADPYRFTDSDNDNLTETGGPTADITLVNGAAAVNNTGDGTATTATNSTNGASTVFTATLSTATLVVDGDTAGESVRPVLYRNGGPAGDAGNTTADGGNSPRLELNDDNTAAEPVAVGGAVEFS